MMRLGIKCKLISLWEEGKLIIPGKGDGKLIPQIISGSITK